MAAIDDLKTAVEQETTVNQSAIKLLGDLAALIKANVNDPAALTDLANKITQNSADLAGAVTANTPVPPPVVPAPSPSA